MRPFIIFTFVIVAFGLLFQRRPEAAIHTPANRFTVGNTSLQTGDIILRTGKGLISEMFRKTSLTDQKFSHAGILVIEQNDWFVYHMLGTNGKSGLIREPLQKFCNSSNNAGFAVYRYVAAKGNEQKTAAYLHHLFTKKPKFDEHFNLNNSDELYCTELIYRMANDIFHIRLPFSKVKNQTFIALDNLYINEYSKKIIEFTY